LGAQDHVLIEARCDYFDQVIKYLIMGNVKRGQMYPLCVGAERVMQAQTIAEHARKIGTHIVAHGCTAAGNDQVRFEVALRRLAPELTILAPVRDQAFKRPEQLAYLEQRKLPIPPYGAAYSINRGLWGVTIGGQETLTSEDTIPEHAWVLSKDAFVTPQPAETHRVGFEQGVPSSLDGERLDPVTLIERLEAIGARFGVGRGTHLGDTSIGSKRRVAREGRDAAAGGAASGGLRAGRAVEPGRRAARPRDPRRASRGHRGALRRRSRRSSRRHHHRPQGPGRLRGAGRRGAHCGTPRAREAG